jgi:DNA polymerase I-like protein with 3'-5' exonuclease and polymerase domains
LVYSQLSEYLNQVKAQAAINGYTETMFGRKRYFELKKMPHAHFVCIKCNAVECIEQIDLNLENYEVSNIIINGTCPKCKK